ncbi:hypothetical protein Ciccas_000214 [Cichlidogyrus casuarinus]|uniref:Piezo TM1-24 domain-containing protein n=1 Tax=Cichlidogyrus casuarinus TaxID=1844966 RepID=A0ABD2QNJ9_9PLAT
MIPTRNCRSNAVSCPATPKTPIGSNQEEPLSSSFAASQLKFPQTNPSMNQSEFWKAWGISTLYNTLCLTLLCLAGITSPSLISFFYILSFLGGCTYWASCHTVGTKNFGCLRVLLLIYSFLHMSLIYLYQFDFFQVFLPDGSVPAR